MATSVGRKVTKEESLANCPEMSPRSGEGPGVRDISPPLRLFRRSAAPPFASPPLRLCYDATRSGWRYLDRIDLMQGARALVRVLEESGVRHIFGLPGDTGMAFYEALRERSETVNHIMTRDERSASFMADVYARASGKVGVCEGPSGGGATYIVPGVAEAHGSAIPLLCLTSDTPVNQRGRGVLTEFDQEAFFRPVTKWAHRIDSPVTWPKQRVAR